MGFHAVDAGPLRNAGALENMAVLWIQLAMSGGAGRHFAFQIVGRAQSGHRRASATARTTPRVTQPVRERCSPTKPD
jgi:hypothetical protein